VAEAFSATPRIRNSIGPAETWPLSNLRGGDPSAPKLTATSSPRQCASAYGRNPFFSCVFSPPRYSANAAFGDANAWESVTRRRRAATFLRERSKRRRRGKNDASRSSRDDPTASIAAISHCAYRRCAAVAIPLPSSLTSLSRLGFVGDARYENPRLMESNGRE
jgi:hypothetical protein